MFKQISIISFGIFFLLALTNSAPTLNGPGEDALNPDEQGNSKIIGFSGFPIEAIADFHQLSKRASGFTNEQIQFQKELLQAHNTYRKRHCVPALQLDDGLSRSAQTYAETLARTNTFEHSGTKGVGENLWNQWSSQKLGTIKGNQPSDDWYNEVKLYNFNNGGFSMATGHFTQLVWKNTQRVGAGIAYTSDRKKVYVVAQYSPPGNYQGQYQQNVLQASC